MTPKSHMHFWLLRPIRHHLWQTDDAVLNIRHNASSDICLHLRIFSKADTLHTKPFDEAAICDIGEAVSIALVQRMVRLPKETVLYKFTRIHNVPQTCPRTTD